MIDRRKRATVGVCVLIIVVGLASLLWPRSKAARITVSPSLTRCLSCGAAYQLDRKIVMEWTSHARHREFARAVPSSFACPLCKATQKNLLDVVCPTCGRAYLLSSPAEKAAAPTPQEAARLCPYDHPGVVTP
jgi:hypothetical protein